MGQKVLKCIVNISCEGQPVEQFDFEKVLLVLQKEKAEKFLHKYE